jgi:hypothetical protein
VRGERAKIGTPSTVLARAETLEDLEDTVVLGGIDSLAVVAHGDLVAVLERLHLHPDQWLLDVSHVVESIADQIREELVEPRAIAHQVRWALGKLERSALPIESGLELRVKRSEHASGIDQGLGRLGSPDPRELQEVVDQALHGAAGLLDPIQEMPALLVDTGPVILTQQAREAQQGDQRRAQVMRHRVDVVLELGVGARQVFLGPAPLGDVAKVGHGAHVGSIAQAQQARRDRDTDHGTVPATELEILTANRACRVQRIPDPVEGLATVDVRVHGLADDFRLRMAQQLLCGRIDVDDQAVAADDDDTVR